MMQVPLRDLTYLSDIELFKIIISSADQFPGLYRFNSTWRPQQNFEELMKLINFLEACFLTEQGKTWRKSEWLTGQDVFFAQNFGEQGRNKDRTDQSVGEFLKTKAKELIKNAHSLSLAIIETDVPVLTILPNTSYYMMGSIIRFDDHSVKISYNDYLCNFHTSLAVSFKEAFDYMNSVFSPQSLAKLFFKAEVIGKIHFTEEDIGILGFDSEKVNFLLNEFTPGATIFGSVDYDSILPIRFAKLIGVSNVCR